MKKVLFMTAIAAFTYCGAFAQTNISLGVRAGLSGSNMKTTMEGLDISLDTKLGFYAGVLAEIGINENFAIQPELSYSQMGAKTDIIDSFTVKEELGYISLPVLFKYKNQGFSVFAGPQIGYLISAQSKYQDVKEDSKDDYKPIDFSGVIGAGYTLENGFGFDARYQMGFANILDAEGGEGATVKNNGFQVGVHYFFNQQ